MRIPLYLIVYLLLSIGSFAFSQEILYSNDEDKQKADQNHVTRYDHFNFLEQSSDENSTKLDEEELELNQLLSAVSVLPSKEFNLTEEIRASNKDKTLIVWGGLVPFVSIPDADEKEQQNAFATENFSIFWHLKKKF
jgi:hypothetical protein